MEDQWPTGKNTFAIRVPKASFPCLPKAHTSQEGKDPTEKKNNRNSWFIRK